MTRLFEAKPFIIAEVGSNWKTLGQCLESIIVAKACGADAVKFQLFDEVALYACGYSVPDYGAPVKPPFLPPAWLCQLKAEADKHGIELMCTAFSPELLAAVDPYVSVHKIASSDAAWPQMLQAVKATGKPALYSIGAKYEDEIAKAEAILNDGKYVATYCVAAYPTDFIDFRELVRFDAFSDHTLGYTAAVQAARLGCIALEKHFTAFPDLDTPDRPHSLTPSQFQRMVQIIRGDGYESEETAMYRRHNRRLVATRDVPAGDALKYGENYGAYRSLVDVTEWISPFDWEKVQGRRASRAIERGHSITEADLA